MTRDTTSNNEIGLAYDPTSADSIIEYAKRLEGKTLREMCDAPDLPDPHTRRGSFGNAAEQYYLAMPSIATRLRTLLRRVSNSKQLP